MVINNIIMHIILTIEKLYIMPIFRKYHYSNTIKMMLFISDIKSYVPLKLCKTSGSIHLFKLTGSMNKDNIKLHKNTIWDVIEIDWETSYSNIMWECN